MLSCVLLAVAFFFQYAKNFEPCPLCLSQRLMIIVIALLSLIVVIFTPSGAWLRFYGGWLTLMSLMGLGLALRQIYLQSLPASEHSMCVPDLEYLINVLPWSELLKMMLLGGENCGKVHWHFLGLTIPGWMTLVFAGMLFIGLIEIFRKYHKV